MPDIEQEYKKQIQELEQQILLLKEQVDFLTRKLYGTKSEKTSALETEGQMSLFNEIETCADPKAQEPDLVVVEKHLRKRKYTGQREKLIKDIPRSKVLHTIDEREQICERCGGTMVKIGEEFVRTEVQFIPASLKVIEHYRETYECRACRKNGTPYMEKSPVPYSPVMHSLASASTIAWLIHQKFELGIPLYRQEKEWEALGLSLSRATMSNWLFAGSPKGAAASAGIYTLVETAKANGLDAMKYIKYILSDMPGSTFLENPEYLDDYLSWDPMVQERCR